jgi:hypothetical protein
MSIFTWLNELRSGRVKACSLYKRGMAKAIRRDQQGAIDDYTAAIGMTDAPPDVVAMTLYNRALVFVSKGDDQQAVDDLEAVLAMGEALINVKTMARQKLARIDARSRKSNQPNH